MLPTCITPGSKMLIDNISYNNSNKLITSEKLITDISDHLAHFIITPKLLQQEPKENNS